MLVALFMTWVSPNARSLLDAWSGEMQRLIRFLGGTTFLGSILLHYHAYDLYSGP